MTTYKPRSGGFRKVKYPLKIYKSEEFSRDDFQNVLEMVKKIKAEDTLDSIQYQDEEPEECKARLLHKNMRFDDRKHSSKSSDFESDDKHQTKELPEVQFSLVPNDLYESCYADNDSLPPFPVTTSSGPGTSSDSEESEQESDYDMDTEDEEWLEANPELNITPNSLEFIFTKLNKRNTHVLKNAIGALPAAFHRDFGHLFPYWKEKRLQNKNLSTFKPNYQQGDVRKKDTKLTSGYIATDPYVTFACKVRKSLPQQHQPPLTLLEKLEKLELIKTSLKRVLGMREKLANFRVWAWNAYQTSLQDRDKIANKITDFTPNHGASTFTNETAESKPKTSHCSRLRKHSNKNASFVKPTPIPTRASARLSTQRKYTSQKTPVNNKSKVKLVAPSTSKILGPAKIQRKENEIKPSTKRRKSQRKPSFVLNGSWKNKRNDRIFSERAVLRQRTQNEIV